jgi:ABC-type transport system involved in multi-copper enzyme maturation permease subunit
MLLGPVFRAELLRTARRRRYYVVRFVYGAGLLLLIWGAYDSFFQSKTTVRHAAVAQYAEVTFVSFAVAQLATVLLLIPALFGGLIADEKQRKTLHYLMASRVSSSEIILDKLLGRMPHLGIFLGIGLPIVCLMSLFGGVPPEYVAAAYLGTVSSGLFAATLAVLISTLARRVRQAVLVSYLLVLGWVFVPSLLAVVGGRLFPAFYYGGIGWANDWLRDSSPFGVWLLLMLLGPGARLGSAWGLHTFLRMVLLQLGAAAVFLLLAIWGLRPIFRRQADTPAHRSGLRLGLRLPQRVRRLPLPWMARPECGDDAVLWKERYFAPVDRFTRLVLIPAIVAVTLPLVFITEIEGNIAHAMLDVLRRGPARSLASGLEWILRIDFGWYFAFWILAVAGAAASSITVEREEDTWVSLTSTPLTGWQIVRGKVFGALWNQRGFAAVLLAVWVLGLLTGAFHPLGVLLGVAIACLLTWFAAALGIHASLRASSTSRALAQALLILAVCNAYPVILVRWFFGELGWESSYSLLGLIPRMAVYPLAGADTVGGFRGAAQVLGFDIIGWLSFLGPRLAIVSFFFGAASLLTWRAVVRFDKWLDRPRITGDGPPPALKTKHEPEV